MTPRGATGGPALVGLGIASLLVVVAGATGGRVGGWSMMVAAVTFPALLLGALAESRRRPGALRVVVWGLGALLLAGGGGLWWWSGEGATVAGLPVSAWLMLGALVLAPLVLAGCGHALTFDEPE